jgi:DNA-damage-inducible protein J
MKLQTSVRVDEAFYNDSKKVFDAFGLSFGDAVNMFLAKVAMEKKIPFDLSLPSDELVKRIENIKTGKSTQTFNSSDEAFKELGI